MRGLTSILLAALLSAGCGAARYGANPLPRVEVLTAAIRDVRQVAVNGRCLLLVEYAFGRMLTVSLSHTVCDDARQAERVRQTVQSPSGARP